VSARRGPPRRDLTIGGRRAVVEAIRAGLARRILVSPDAHRSQGLDALIDEAGRAGVQVERMARPGIERLRRADLQGVAAVIRPPRELDERALVSRPFDRDALIVVLDGITDPQNLGASARSAEAAGASTLVVRRARSAPLSDAAIRASAGALLHVPVARVPNLARVIDRLRDRGFFAVGLDHRAKASVYEADRPGGPLCVVVGAEDEGISRLVREGCDLLVSIPMHGRTGSLNASAALAVALFAYARRPSD
jgi:23S rRNA (guanosine2251-2'-O)-methyltransferase